MIQTADIAAFLDRWAPPSIAESWDTVGLITGSKDMPVETVLLTLDITDQTIAEAANHPHPLIIAHHPLLFTPTTRLSGTDRPVRLMRELIRRDISAFIAHTNLDQAVGGVSESLGSRLGLHDMSPLTSGRCRLVKFVTFVPADHTNAVREAASQAGAGTLGEYSHCSFTSRGTGTFMPSGNANPYLGARGELSREPEDRIEMIVPEPFAGEVVTAVRDAHPYEEMAYDIIPLALDTPTFGYGAVGELPEPMSRDAFKAHVCLSLDCQSITCKDNGAENISRIAVMGGSGSKLVSAAIRADADAFVSGDIDHHTWIDYASDIMLIDASHAGTERPVLDSIRTRLTDAFSGLTISIEQTGAPFTYWNC